MGVTYSLKPALDRHGNEIRGVWRAKVSLGKDHKTGKYVQKSKTIKADSLRGARRLADDWADAIKGTDSTGTVAALAEAWMLRISDRNKASTMRSYRTKLDLHILPVLGPVPLLELDRSTMDQWQVGIEATKDIDGEKVKVRASPRTRNQCIGIVRAMFRWGHKVGRIHNVDFLNALEQEKPQRGREPAAEDDLKILFPYLRHMDPEVFAMVWLAFTTGMRRGEILGLRTGDIDLERSAILVQNSLDRSDGLGTVKTEKSGRAVAIDELTAELLAFIIEQRRQQFRAWVDVDAALPGDRWIFPSPRDPEKPWAPDAVNKRLARRVAEAGLPPGSVTLHMLRHNMGTVLMDSGTADQAITDRMGHESMAITKGIYIGRLDATDRESARKLGEKASEFLGLAAGD